MAIDYDHSINFHFTEGPRLAFPLIFQKSLPSSLLDVGCGVGTWLKMAIDAGVEDVLGIDGVSVAPNDFLVSKTLFRQQDLTQTWNLNRRFDTALCLEVAEHLDSQYAVNLIKAITAHASEVVFGAACPGQTGQHHVNCQWPEYWQRLFNERGFACYDEVRWRLWQNPKIEPWYKQNIFIAREEPQNAGKEPRIPSVIHPEMYQLMVESNFRANAAAIGEGALPFKWYLSAFPRTFFKKIANRFR